MPIRSTLALSISIGLAVALAGCAGQIPFSSAVNQYNTDTEKAQDSAILLNVIRASKRRPLVFFDVTTVTGSSPATGSLGFSLPLSNLSSTAATAAPTLNFSGGPSVSAGPVVTQDFYKGVLAPVSAATIDLFVQRGVNRDLLFNLIFEKIEFATMEDVDTHTFKTAVVNYPSDDTKHMAFQRVVEALVDAGLTTLKSDGDSKAYGPAYLPDDLVGHDHDLVARAAAAGLGVNVVNWCDAQLATQLEIKERARAKGLKPIDIRAATSACDDYQGKIKRLSKDLRDHPDWSESQRKPDEADKVKANLDWIAQMAIDGAPPYFYRLEKAADGSDFNFGIDPALAAHPISPPPKTIHRAKSATTNLGLVLGSDTEKSPQKFNEFCDLIFGSKDDKNKNNASIDDCKQSKPTDIEIKFVPRSTYSIIYYLGEIVRRDLYPDVGKSGHITSFRKTPLNGEEPPPAGCWAVTSGPGCAPIFLVAAGAGPAFLSVRYDGGVYIVPSTSDPSSAMVTDRTYEVMDILTELIALNRSSKDVPTSNVFTLRGLP